MELVVLSFVAGVLTILAPCILSFLPIILGSSVEGSKPDIVKVLSVTGALIVSILIFTLLLKTSTILLDVPLRVWQIISGSILVLLGVSGLYPRLWEPVGARLNLGSNSVLAGASRKRGPWKNVLIGAALGPVFNSCSPTYAFIVAAILPVSFARGIGYLIAYVVGLGLVLVVIGILGQQAVSKLRWASNPRGWLKRAISIIFILTGLFIATGLDHQLQAFLVEQGWYDPLSRFERSLMP